MNVNRLFTHTVLFYSCLTGKESIYDKEEHFETGLHVMKADTGDLGVALALY